MKKLRSATRLALGLLLLLAAPLAALAAPAVQALRADTGQEFKVHAAGPEDAPAGILLVHDWFGVTPFFQQAVEKLASQGYRVLGVDLYGGRHAATHQQAGELMKQMDRAQAGIKIDTALRTLQQRQRRLAVMGFSMGAMPALEAAMRHKSVVASVLWYGETVNEPARLKALAGPVLLVVGSKDGPSAPANAASFARAADEAGVGAEIHIYPGAAHAFAQPLFNQGATYDPQATEVAWQISTAFLSRHLK